MLQQVYRRYELETSLSQKQQRSSILSEEIPKAKYHLRGRQEALMNYEHGSIRGFLDKVSGKREEKLELLRADIRKAEAALALLQQERESLSSQQTAAEKELASLPGWSELRAQPGDTGKEAARLEARLCAGILTDLLDRNLAALTEARGLLRGERAGEIMSYQEQHRIHAAAEQTGEQCRILLQRMKEALDALDIPFQISGYYRSPTAYTAGAAANFIRLERMGEAMDQVLDTKKQVAMVSQKLEV